jgi:hypothetical protein
LKLFDPERFTWIDFLIVVICIAVMIWLGGKLDNGTTYSALRRYWPTSIRVDTDMDSSWLKGEERTCQTYPNNEGSIDIVACNPSGTHRDHNIPVTFWGYSYSYIFISKWKCRKENTILGDEFACRAIE